MDIDNLLSVNSEKVNNEAIDKQKKGRKVRSVHISSE
jgi:hypothetical protein